MSEKNIAVKSQKVDAATELMNNASSMVVFNYRGLTVAEATDLRKQLRDSGVKMSVIKNKVLERAADKAGLSDLKDLFNGPTAIAFASEDAVAAPKIVHNYAKTNDALVIKGGVIDGKAVSVDEISVYATMPSRDELLSTLANILQAPVRNVAYAVKAVADSKSDDGDAA